MLHNTHRAKGNGGGGGCNSNTMPPRPQAEDFLFYSPLFAKVMAAARGSIVCILAGNVAILDVTRSWF